MLMSPRRPVWFQDWYQIDRLVCHYMYRSVRRSANELWDCSCVGRHLGGTDEDEVMEV